LNICTRFDDLCVGNNFNFSRLRKQNSIGLPRDSILIRCFLVYLIFNIGCTASSNRTILNDEMEGMWKEAVVVYWKICYQQVLRKTMNLSQKIRSPDRNQLYLGAELVRYMRFDVFTAVRIIMLFFWVLSPCRPVGSFQSLGEIYCLHLQGSIFSPEDGDIMFLRNVAIYRRVYTAPKPRRTSLSWFGLFYIFLCNGNHSCYDNFICIYMVTIQSWAEFSFSAELSSNLLSHYSLKKHLYLNLLINVLIHKILK
jgi:hypothetical protein